MSQGFPSPGGGFVLVSGCASHLSFQASAVRPPLVFAHMSPLFGFNLFSPVSGCMSFVFGRDVLHEFVFLVSESSEGLGNGKRTMNSLHPVPSTRCVRCLFHNVYTLFYIITNYTD